MNYQKHYDLLCERAKNRVNKGYTEKHHIVPRCLGGTDEKENLVRLTPEEHYVAHQLLTKIYPNHKGLFYAVIQMTGHSNSKERKNNKLYGWLRRKCSSLAKQRTGDKNGSYGRHWYHNPETEEVIKCLPEEVPEGFVKGGSVSPYVEKQCEICGARFLVPTTNQKRKTCSEECSYELMSNKSKKNNKELYDYSLILKIYKEKKRTGKGYWSLAQKYNVNKWSIYDYIKRHKAQLEKDTNGK